MKPSLQTESTRPETTPSEAAQSHQPNESDAVSLSELEDEIKELIVRALALEDVEASDIDREQILFGEGLGLDSVDALELGVALHKRYGINVDPDAEGTRQSFASVASLAKFVEAERTKAR